MHLQVAPDAPLLIRAAATSILVLHMGAGCAAIGWGAVAMAVRKGGPLHRSAGKVFFVAMLVTLAIGGAVAPFIGEPVNLIGSVFGVYLVVTGWAAARRGANGASVEKAALLLPLAAAPLLLAFGWLGAHSAKGVIEGVPYQAAYALALVAALAGALDLKAVLGSGLARPQRVARHLWRMSLALFFACGSLFLGQPQVFPAALRGSPLLIALAFAPLVLMIFWLVRVRLPRRRRPAPAAA